MFSTLMALVTVASVMVIGAPAAQAAGSCSGTIIYSQVQSSGLGELVIYYNSSNGGTNSACFYHRGAAYGRSAPTFVQIYRCAERSGEGAHCTRSGSADTDSGDFSYHAGPVASPAWRPTASRRSATSGGRVSVTRSTADGRAADRSSSRRVPAAATGAPPGDGGAPVADRGSDGVLAGGGRGRRVRLTDLCRPER
ncbi:hypothetical protein [Micromonospora sp. C31]|uniref:hypothetical protein n=1 Tax=Micromonospora sp. C31 TaxID=2824876 RepID=UPI001FFD7D28|nr:hypothetical protein [Micromonospora sp. C31]